MSIEVLAVGDELLMGATLDTNSGFVARELFGLGLELGRVTIVGDRAADLRDAVDAALARAQVLIVTGGLGPTVDDLTKEIVAAHFGDPLEIDAAVLAELRRRFERRGRPMPEVNVKQALVPRSAAKIPNPVGSAPGVHWSREGREVFLLPGIPAEMRAMLRGYVLPRLQALWPPAAPRFAAFRTCGLAESEIAQRLQPMLQAHRVVRWAFYPGWEGVDVRVRAAAAVVGDPDWQALCDGVREALGHHLYSEDAQESVAEVVQRLMTASGRTLAVAESCTGGLVGARVTDISGSSAYFRGGFIAYADRSKEQWLGVPADVLREHGAVSAPVAAAMARGARARAASDLAVAITGIAGPTGGTPDKPVGLVFLGLAAAEGCWTRRLQLGEQRDVNRQISSLLAIDMVRRQLLGLPVGDPA